METLIRREVAWNDLETLQAELVQRVAHDPRQRFLLVSEPQPTFTYGRSSKASDLIWTDPDAHGVAVHEVARGGLWTYHGPGQVVIYPIAFLPTLGYPKRAARRFLCDLARSVRLYLQTLGLESEVRPTPFGVYLPQGKIASFGMSLRNGISSHGVAVYVKNQSPYFKGIVPCGVSHPSFASLEEAGISLSWDAAATGLSNYIKRGFQASKT